MSNEITRAIRKLRGLKEDVERLKSGTDEEGQTRFLRLITDRIVVSDLVSTGKDAIVLDEVTVSDAVSTAKDAIVTDEVVTADVVSAVKDAVVSDETATTDSVAAQEAATQPAYHGEGRHDIDHHS